MDGLRITERWPQLTPDLAPYRLEIGDIVIGMDGALVGRNVATLTHEDVPSILVQRVARIRGLPQLESAYAYLLLSTPPFLRHIDTRKTHTAIPHITASDIREYPVAIPKPDEQRQILNVVVVNEAIAKTEAVIMKLRQVRAGLLHDLLTRGLDKNGQLRDPNVQPELFQDAPLGKFPREWDIKSLDALCAHIGSGVTPRGGQDVYTSTGVMLIRSQNVTFEGLLLDDVAFIPNDIHLGMLRSEVYAHDVLFNITGASIGRCCPMPSGLFGTQLPTSRGGGAA